MIDEIIKFNNEFVEEKRYIPYISERLPKKKLAILSCMDTRLTHLLPAALNLKNGEAKIITNAGALVTHPFGSVMRSLLVAVYGMSVRDIMVIGHTDCGMENLDLQSLVKKMEQCGIFPDKVNICECNTDLHKWLRGFDNTNMSVTASVDMIKKHPLMPKDITVRGFVMDINTGGLSEV
ncbi:MAG: carbonic anhydrase [Alphaproteobacteria bacterium]|nr:carbonic anhydrase [Alphaproteobacteria bacterium]